MLFGLMVTVGNTGCVTVSTLTVFPDLAGLAAVVVQEEPSLPEGCQGDPLRRRCRVRGRDVHRPSSVIAGWSG